MLSKEQAERVIFEELARLASLYVRPDSITQPKPPRPDIECLLLDETPFAVELVSLDAVETQTRLAHMDSTDEAWRRALALHDPKLQDRLRAECSDAFIALHFSEFAGARDRKEILRTVQSALLAKPTGFAGELFSDLELPEGLQDCTVHRGGVRDGPRLLAPSAGRWLPPQYEKITEKLTRKTYETSARLELFAYSTHDAVDAHVDSLATIIRTISKHLPGSRFSRVRVFDLLRRRQEYASP